MKAMEEMLTSTSSSAFNADEVEMAADDKKSVSILLWK